MELYHFVDLLADLAFILIQSRIAQLLIRWAARRYAGKRRAVAILAVVVLNALLALVYILSLWELVSLKRFTGETAAYLGALAYLYLMLAGGVLIIHWLWNLFRKPIERMDPERRRIVSAAGKAVLAAPFAVLAYGSFIERLDFRTREVDLPVPDLPQDLDGLRIVQISDIHLSPFLSEKQLAGVIDSANGLKPHLIAVTGDLVTSRGDPIEAAVRQLGRLRADAGIYGCMGNHDVHTGVARYVESECARLGIRFLRGSAEALRFGSATLNLAGSDYEPKSSQPHYLRGMDRFVRPGAVNLLLQHNPDVFPAAARQGYNLLLAGHTHGGQVTVEILDRAISPAAFFTPYVYGLYRSGGSAAYVTRGIGTIGVPTRIGAPPELALLRLRKA